MRALFCLLLAAGTASSATEWLELSSSNFRLYTNASAGEARRTLEYFEQVRDFFMRVKSSSMTTRLPVTIVLFRGPKDYKPYAPNESAAAYYIGDRSRDFIVLSDGGEEHYPTAVHEYMHLLLRHMEMKVPVWLNEGIAQVYSTLKPYAGKIMIGTPPAGTGYALHDKWLTVEQLFAVDHRSPEYNERNRAGMFYSQSWVLTHMLMLDARFSPKFGELARLLSSGVSSQDAFRTVYNMDGAQILSAMRNYVASNSLKAVLFDTRLQKMQIGEPAPADAFGVDLTLARLTFMLGRPDAKSRLDRLASEYTKRWEVHEALAQYAWRNKDLEGARQHLANAIQLDPKDWNVLWDYARLAVGDPTRSEVVIDALQRSLSLNGNNIDARLMLGWEHYRAKNYKDALSVFATVRNVDGERAPRLFLGIGATAVQMEKWDEARSAANQALKYAREEADQTQAKLLIAYLDRRERHMAEAQQPGPALTPSRLPAPVDSPALAAELPISVEVRGRLKQVDCIGTKARLHIVSGDRAVALLIVNPDGVLIRNEPGSSVTMSCGAQPAGRIVTVEYVEREDPVEKTTGDVKTLEFAATSK